VDGLGLGEEERLASRRLRRLEPLQRGGGGRGRVADADARGAPRKIDPQPRPQDRLGRKEVVRERGPVEQGDRVDAQIAGVEIQGSRARGPEMQRDLALQDAPIEVRAQRQIDASRLRLVGVGVAVRIEAHARDLACGLLCTPCFLGRMRRPERDSNPNWRVIALRRRR